MKLLKKVTMENTLDNHCKVWECLLFSNDLVITEWGSLLNDARQSKSFPKAGEKFFNKKIAEKIKKGYEIV